MFGGIIVAYIPIILFGLVVRQRGVSLLEEAHEHRMRERTDRLYEAWELGGTFLEQRLGALDSLFKNDNFFVSDLRSAKWLQVQHAFADFAASSGLHVAYLLDANDTILAASHFPLDRRRHSPELAELADHEAPVVAEVAFPDSGRTVLSRARWFKVGIGEQEVVGVVGQELDSLGVLPPVGGEMSLWAKPLHGADGFLVAGPEPVAAAADADARFQGSRVIRQVLWRIGAGGGEITPVNIEIAWHDGLLADTTQHFHRVFSISLVLGAVLAIVLSALMARRFSDPVERLAATAERVKLGRSDTAFPRGGARELDQLGKNLNRMLQRNRDDVVKLRDAQKRAGRGEFARQVNHDMRNGLVPIRNVVSHLSEACAGGPESLWEVFDARARNLTESLGYLDTLAERYRLEAGHEARGPSDICAVVTGVVEGHRSRAGVRFTTDLGEDPAWVEMDAVDLRRVVDNIVFNAVTAMAEKDGEVKLSIRPYHIDGLRPGYRLSVVDDGPGIPAEALGRVFEPSFTTRVDGTGRGLTGSRELVRKVGGEITLESVEGRGTRVDVVLKEAEEWETP